MASKRAMITILYVEDDELVKSIVEIALHEAGFDLLIATSGTEAVAMIEEKAGGIRGLVTDIDLGIGATGWDVARRGRELIDRLPVIYVSGASSRHWASKGVPDSVMIAKPFAPAQIVSALSSLLNAGGTKH